MNEIQYCLKSAIVAACVPAFRRIKPYLAISPIFFFFFLPSVDSDTLRSSFFFCLPPHQPNPLATHRFHSFIDSLFLLLLLLLSVAIVWAFSHPNPARSPSSLPLFPLREQWECFPRAPSVAPRLSVARAQNWLEILAVLVEGWNFKEDVLANLASSAPPSNWNPSGWHCFNWEHWGPDNLLALFPALPLHRFQLQTLTPGGTSVKVTVLSSLASWHCPAPPQPVFCLSCSPLISLSQYLSFLHVSLIILPVFIWSDLTLHYKKKGIKLKIVSWSTGMTKQSPNRGRTNSPSIRQERKWYVEYNVFWLLAFDAWYGIFLCCYPNGITSPRIHMASPTYSDISLL